MRSLTDSSAGIPFSPPTTPPPSYIPSTSRPATVSGTQPSLSFPSTFPHTHPYTENHALSQQLSFFNVDNDSLLLSSHARKNVNEAIRDNWANSTVKRYSSAIQLYLRFCDMERIPQNLRFPADEFVLCAFAASSIGQHSSSTPRSRLSALKAWHVAHNIEWKGSPRLRYVLNGVHKRAPGSSKRRPRPPINAKMLSQLVENLDLNSPFDATVAACATTAFWGQCRLGELIPTSAAVLVSTPFPTRAGFNRSVRNPQSCLLHLPRTKTHHHGQDVVLVDQRAPVNPISLLKNHLRVNNVPRDTPLFSYISEHGIHTLTKPLFLQRCNAIWQLFGYPRTTGHSFRIGGTTELLIAGTPPDVVKAMGRWSSESFLRYWRSLEDIAPLHTRNLHPPIRKHIRRRPPTVRG